uniref:Putative endochitinase A isoform X2 n=1 Tax=Davidia involucrata TaxID=16924 RepID=A0A5B6YY67_DAVIN
MSSVSGTNAATEKGEEKGEATAVSETTSKAENQNEHRSRELLEAVDAVKAEDTADNLQQRDKLPQQCESFERERTRKIGKCNLRKSLAWDSAFFTSAGVLDPDELSSMIEGVEKSERNLLPGIEEDICRSTDSISTLESESLTLENFEGDLFEDIRASIQKSSKASNVGRSSSKSASKETETQALCSSKKLDLASQNKMKAKPVFKKESIVVQGPGRLVKQGSGCPQVTQMKPVARNGDSSSSLPKPPKSIGRANPIPIAPTKRASLGTSRVKMENDDVKSTTVASKGALASKVPGLAARRVLPKPALSSKSSSLGSTATRTESTISSSSCDSSASASSNNIGRPPMNSVRRKIDSRTVNPPSSGSIRKTPSKIALKNKTQSGKSGISARLMSSKLSSSTSPASSISDWSSESSSSASTVNRRSNNFRASLDSSSSCRSMDSDTLSALDIQKHSNDQISDGGENQVAGLLSQNVKKAATQIGTLSSPAPSKPSGLRMPSPKIGFFDGVKSLVRTPKGGLQSHSGLPTGLPKVGSGICSLSGGLNKPKLGKLQSATTVAAMGNMKLDTRKPASPLPLQDPSNALTKIPSASRGVKYSPAISPKVMNKTVGESCLNAEEVGATKRVPDHGLDAEKNGSLGVECVELTNFSNTTPLSTSPTTLGVTAGTRTPFAAKNSFCNGEGLDFPTGFSIEVVEEKTSLPSLETAQKENS